jgi:hypothetical protein
MDIRYHLRILSRWRAVLVGGFLLAALLAIVATFKVSTSGLDWRADASYMSQSKVIVTQPGFPWGRAKLPGADPTQPIVPNGRKQKSFAPPERFADLAVIYAYIAQSEPVHDLITPKPLEEQISVGPLSNPASGDPLPLLSIEATANSAEASRTLNSAVISALRKYLGRNVNENNVPQADRVELDVLNPPKAGALVSGRSPALPVLVWLLAMAATIVAVYVLENLYPGRRVGEGDPEDGDAVSAVPGLELIEPWDTEVPGRHAGRAG